jgi:hypothetical protein
MPSKQEQEHMATCLVASGTSDGKFEDSSNGSAELINHKSLDIPKEGAGVKNRAPEYRATRKLVC